MRGRQILTAVLVVLGVLLLAGFLGRVTFFWPGMPGMMGFGYYGYRFAPWMGIAAILFRTLLLLGGLLLLVTVLRQGRFARAESTPSVSRPLDILRERYARGELTKEQFDQMRHDLES